ncbi:MULTISPECIES: tyrosine-type recombinase/integrase [Staphylococcus]|uniref:tyrosine-type recombinase/integrase n=1 Tax=Staphylococcus TaxID=1279 RepID=UPI002553BBD5|nr:tyrosine-type recombinase/integrase [Staphylococcus equorum]MDK9855236.1 tyrosine-type recombinase/integrase [Staphylococcus equorum]HDE4301212.1 site-specific integrase [Staphylococcus aureus]
MEIKAIVSQFNNNSIIEKRQNVDFNTFDTVEYEVLFKQLSSKKSITGSFKQTEWQLSCDINNHYIPIKFDIDRYPEINLALKKFTITRLLSGRKSLTIYNEVIALKKAILASAGFNDTDSLEKLLTKETQHYSYQGYHLLTVVKSFMSFYKIPLSKKIINLCNGHLSKKKLQRNLPAFEDIITFDEVLNDYFQNNSTEDTLEYLPIKLWWLLTNIIPLRPTEFLSLKKDCLEFNANYISPYRIKIQRIKQKNTEYNISEDQIERIEIDESTYKLMKNIIFQLATVESESKYLLPVELLYAFRQKKYTKKNERINRRDFDLMKKQFYENIVEGKYGIYNLDRIKSGDTRHFAIINMALQGFNMLSIARMAGHDEIRSQYSYYSHAEHFSQSYVYRLSQNQIENKISNNMEGGIIGWKRYIYDKGRTIDINQYNLDKIVGRVKYGFCTEEKSIFPDTCIEYCKFCPKFAFKPAINEREEAIDWLTNTSDDLSVKIKESIILMRDLSMNLSKTYIQGNNDLLKSTSKQLAAFMDKKATIDSNLLEDEALERE